jgi:hypothetical protein
MKSLLVAMALLGQGTYVVYREFVVEPVPILQIATIGAATAFIGAAWLLWRWKRGFRRQ